MPASSPSLKELFLAALAIAPADRAAWLERECANDPALQLRVEQMLAAHETPQSLLDGPALVGDRPEGVTGAFKPAPAEAPGTMIGPYKLLELIGEGGMGLVNLAEQRQPIQPCQLPENHRTRHGFAAGIDRSCSSRPSEQCASGVAAWIIRMSPA